MEPKRVSLPAMNIVGLSVRTDNAREATAGQGKLGGLWAELYGGALTRLPNPADEFHYGVYFDYSQDDSGPYTVLAGVRVKGDPTIVKGLKHCAVPRQNYLLFEATGLIPQVVPETWELARRYLEEQQDLRRTFDADVERYDPARPGHVQLFVSVATK